MKTRYRLTRRGSRGDTSYCVDTLTRTRTRLKTSDERAARKIVDAKNDAEVQPDLNRQLARAYLLGSDSQLVDPSNRATQKLWPHSRFHRKGRHFRDECPYCTYFGPVAR